MPRRSSARSGAQDEGAAPLQPGQPDRVRALAGRRGGRRRRGRAARARRRHRRGLRGVVVGRHPVHLGLRARRRRDRDPQPRQEPLDAAAPARLPRGAGRAGRPLHPHARVGLPPRQHRLPGGGAGGPRRPARLARAHPRRDRSRPCRRNRRRRRDTGAHGGDAVRCPVPLRRLVRRGAPEQLEAVGLPVVDGAAFEGPGYARLPFGGATEAREPLQDALARWAQLHAR